MGGKVKEISSESEFHKIISGSKVVICDWYATWCGPCKMIAPRVEKMSEKYPNIEFIKVDVDKLNSLASSFGVSAMPTFHFFQSSKKLDEVVGADVGKIERLLHKYSSVSSGSGGAFTGTGRVLGSGEPAKGGAGSTGKGTQSDPNLTWQSTNTLFLIAIVFMIYKYFFANSSYGGNPLNSESHEGL